MISRQEYAYGIGDEIVHNGEILKYRGYYNGHLYTTTVDHESGGICRDSGIRKQIEK